MNVLSLEVVVRLTIFALLAFPASLLLVHAWKLYRFSAREWQAVSGRVLRSEVEEKLVSVRVSTSAARRRLAKRYQPVIVYEYQVGNQHYKAQRLFLGDVVLYSSAADAQKALERYPKPGELVTVWYDPCNHAETVLQKSVHWQFWVVLLLGVGLAAGASFFLWR